MQNSRPGDKVDNNRPGSEPKKMGVFQPASELLTQSRKALRISTGSADVDRLLGGGIEQRAITEFYGAFRTGKTQICMQLAVNVALPKEFGGLGAKVVYLDTEGNFRAERVTQMCEAYEIDPVRVLENILFAKIGSTDEQMELMSEVSETVKNGEVILLVIDSLTSNFRTEFVGGANLLERQYKLNRHLSQLAQLSVFEEDNPVAVVVTNQVLSDIINPEQELSAVGGHIVAHASTHRILLSRTTEFIEKTPILKATLIDSPYLPEVDAKFKITRLGIEDGNNTTTQNFKSFLDKLKNPPRQGRKEISGGSQKVANSIATGSKSTTNTSIRNGNANDSNAGNDSIDQMGKKYRGSNGNSSRNTNLNGYRKDTQKDSWENSSQESSTRKVSSATVKDGTEKEEASEQSIIFGRQEAGVAYDDV